MDTRNCPPSPPPVHPSAPSNGMRDQSGAAFLMAVLGILLLGFTLVAGLRYTGSKVAVTRQQSTTGELSRVLLQSIHGFVASHNRLPCPADGSLGSSDPNYGTEAAALCVTSPANPGIVPWKALGLQKSDALDAWGMRIGYAVSAGLATGTPYAAPITAGSDAINVQPCSGTLHACGTLAPQAYALISYGADQTGGWMNCDGTGSVCARRTQPVLAVYNPEYYNAQTAAFASSAPAASAFSQYSYSVVQNQTQYYDDLLTYETSSQICAALNGKKTGSSAPYCTSQSNKPVPSQPTQPQVASGAPALALQNSDLAAVASNPVASGIVNAYGCGAGSSYCPGSSNAGSLSNTLSFVGSGNGTVYNPGGNCASLVGNLGFACVYDPLWASGISIGGAYGQGGGGGDWIGPNHTGSCPQCYGNSWTPNYLVPTQTLTYIYGSSYQSFAFAAYLVDGGMPIQADAYSSNVCSVSGDVTQNSNAIANVGPAQMVAGAALSGPGITAGTTIKNVNNNNLVMSQGATQTLPGSLITATLTLSATGNVTSGSTSVTNLSTTSGLTVAQVISGSGIPSGSVILAINGTTLTLSQAATGSYAGTALTIGGGSVTFNGDLQKNSPSVGNVTPPCAMAVGQLIEGLNTLPSGTTITAVGNQSLTVSKTALATQIGQTLAIYDNAFNITGKLTTGSQSVTNASSTNGLALGQAVSGPGIQAGSYLVGLAGTTLTLSRPAIATSNAAQLMVTPWVRQGSMVVSNDTAGNVNHSVAVTGSWTATSAPPNQVTQLSSNLGLAVGQTVAGAGIPPGTVISGISATLTLSNQATATQTGLTLPVIPGSISFTGTLNGTTTISPLSSTAGLAAGQSLSGTGIAAGTTITAVGVNSLTISPKATLSQSNVSLSASPGMVLVQGTLSNNSNVVTALSCTTALSVGQAVVGPGLPANTTITAITPSTLTLSNSATANQNAATLAVGPGVFGVFGSVTNGSITVSGLSSMLNLAVGQAVAGPGIPAGTAIKALGTSSVDLTQSANANANGTNVFLFVSQDVLPLTGSLTGGSNLVTNLSNLSGLAVGQAVIDATGNIPAGTTITSINSSQSSLLLSQSANSTAAALAFSVVQGVVNPSGSLTNGSAVITSPSFVSGLFPGEAISGTGVPAGTTITSVTGTGIGLSQVATATLSGGSLAAAPGILAVNGDTTSGLTTVANAVVPPGVVVGNSITGPGIPSGTVITGIDIELSLSKAPTIAGAGTLYAAGINLPAAPISGTLSSGSTTVANVSSVSGLTAGQTIAGASIQADTTIATVTAAPVSLTLSAPATSTQPNDPLTVTQGTVFLIGSLTANSATVGGIASFAGLAVGDPVSGGGIPTGTTILTMGNGTLTLSQKATATNATATLAVSQVINLTGSLLLNSGTVSNPSTVAGLAVGQSITGTGIAAGTTITGFSGSTLTLSKTALTTPSGASNLFVTERKPVTGITGTFNANSAAVTLNGTAAPAGLYVGASIAGPGIPGGTTVKTINGTALTLSQNTTAAGAASPLYFSGWITGITGTFASGSPVLTLVNPTTGLAVGQEIIAPGLPIGTTIAAISGSTLTLSAAATTNGSGPLIAVTSPSITPANDLGVLTSGSNTIPYPTTTPAALPGLGQTVTGSGLNSGAQVIGSANGTLTLSSQATATSATTGESLFATYPACPGPAAVQGTTTPGGLYLGVSGTYPAANYPPPVAPIPQHPPKATAATILSQIWPQPHTAGAGTTSANSNANALGGNYIDQRDNQFTNRQFVDASGNPQIFNILVFQVLPYVYATGNGAVCAGAVSPTGACPWGNGLTYSYGILFEGMKGCFTDSYTTDCSFDPRADEWANPPVAVTMDCGQRP